MAALALTVLSVVSGTLASGCGRQRESETRARLLAVGAEVPDVVGVDHNGRQHRLRAFAVPTVVYFYPKDGTPGCTKEACAFRDVWDRYQRAGIAILGVSKDPPEVHRTFAAEHDLPFPLISDENAEWSEPFGVKSVLGVYERVSFLVGRDGRIARVYPRVDPGVHAAEVLGDAMALP